MGATTSEEKAIQLAYPDVNATFQYSERTIITEANTRVDELNGKVLAQIDGYIYMVCT